MNRNTISQMLWRKSYFSEDNRTPIFHYEIVDHFLNNSSKTKCVKAFRGSAKSANVAYLALHSIERGLTFVMIVSATATLAEGLIDGIKNMILDSELPYEVVRIVSNEIQLRYGGRDFYILAMSAGSAIRGTKRGNRRPELIIVDDLMRLDESMNKMRRDRLVRWFYSDLKPSLDPVIGEVWVVGTPMRNDDILDLLTKKFPTLEIPLGYGVWSDRFSDEYIDELKEEYRSMGLLLDYKREFELVIADSETSIFDVNKIRTIGEDNVPDDLTYYCTLDGAFSEKESADYSAFAVLGIDRFNRWYVFSYDMKKSPQEVIDRLFSLQAKFGFLDVGIEKGSFRLAMKSEIEDRHIRYQQYFNVIELSVAGSKLSRIKALSSIINSGRLTIVDTGDSSERLMEQIELTTAEGVMAGSVDNIDSMAQLLQLETFYHHREVYDEDEEDYNTVTGGLFR